VSVAEECFKLRQELRGEVDDDFNEPDTKSAYASHGNWRLVGYDMPADPQNHANFVGRKACSREVLHNRVKYGFVRLGNEKKIVRCVDKAYVKLVFHYCNKPSCCLCYKHGWATRFAMSIEKRLLEASKKFGEIHHIIVGLPPSTWGLDYKTLKEICLKGCSVRGVIGGIVIFHGFRFNDISREWHWSCHFHIIGFLRDGYSKCRRCLRCVKGCGLFRDRSYRANETDKLIFKVKGPRESVWGTARYQLDHSSIDVSVKRFRLATWFGVCGWRKLKVKVAKHEEVCPFCKHDLVWHDYFGCNSTVKYRGELGKKGVVSVEDIWENGVRVYLERESPPKGYG